jgi:hypothetical protein
MQTFPILGCARLLVWPCYIAHISSILEPRLLCTYLIIKTTFEELSIFKSVFDLFLDDLLFSKLIITVIILGFEEIGIGTRDNFPC